MVVVKLSVTIMTLHDIIIILISLQCMRNISDERLILEKHS